MYRAGNGAVVGQISPFFFSASADNSICMISASKPGKQVFYSRPISLFKQDDDSRIVVIQFVIEFLGLALLATAP